MPSFVQTDNFLFSDDDVGGSDAIAFVKVAAGEPDVVPDSSDEASTGPALDMDLQAEETSMGRDAFYEGKQDNHDSYAHMEASSHTRQAFKTSHMDLVSNPLTVDPRDLAARPKSSDVNKTPQARDSEARPSSQVDTSIATTEVIPSQREDTASEKTVSPAERPGMLGRALLQGPRSETAAEAVKSRQRPKARPLVLASKEVRAAIRGASPPRTEPKKAKLPNNAEASTSAVPVEDDEDDELRLKSRKNRPVEKPVASSSRNGVNNAPSKGPARVVESSSDDNDDQPMRKSAKEKYDAHKKPERADKGKGRQKEVAESGSASDSAAEINEDLRVVGQVMAKESEEDSDYNGKGEVKDRWAKKAKKRKGQVKSSRIASEEPASRSTRPSKQAKGQPSAVYPGSKKVKPRNGREDDLGSDEEEPVEVGTVRKTSRTDKKGKVKASKMRSPKGNQPRSKEFLDDEDMADDQITTTWSQMHQSAVADSCKPQTRSGPALELSDGETEALPSSSDAPVSNRAKAIKTYGKKYANRNNARIVDSDEETVSNKIGHPKTADCPTLTREAGDKANTLQSRARRSNSPAYAVIIDNSAKKSRPPSARGNGTSSRPRQGVHTGPALSVMTNTTADSISQKDEEAHHTIGRKASKLTVVESEDDPSSDEDSKSRVKSAQTEQLAERGKEEISAGDKKAETLPSKPALQIKDRNASVVLQKLAAINKGAGETTPAPPLKSKAGSTDTKPLIGSTGKRFHDMVVAKGGGQGIKSQGLSKRSVIPSLLTFRGVPPPKKKPIPLAPVKKKKKGDEVYSDDDLEELNDQPEEWWEADDFYAWEQRKRKRAKAKGEIDSDEERELTEKGKKMKTEGSLSAIEDGVAEVEHFSD